MTKSHSIQLFVSLFLVAVCVQLPVWAQGAGGQARGTEEQARITRFPPPGKTAMVRTPEFNVGVNNIQPRVTRRPREWALFEIKYDTSAKWTDELLFQYHLITKGKSEEGKGDTYSYYNASVRYINIPKGTHMSSVALPPSLVERYGEPVAVALEITAKDGTVLDSQSATVGINLPKEWWRDTNVMDKVDQQGNPFLARRVGLLERSKTPFALVNIDDYEVVQ